MTLDLPKLRALAAAAQAECEHCEEQLGSCIGSYDEESMSVACDECCAHGNEDGHCRSLGELVATAIPALLDRVEELQRECEQLRGVVDVAIAWRDTWRHRRPFGDEDKAVALVDVVDAYVNGKETPDAR